RSRSRPSPARFLTALPPTAAARELRRPHRPYLRRRRPRCGLRAASEGAAERPRRGRARPGSRGFSDGGAASRRASRAVLAGLLWRRRSFSSRRCSTSPRSGRARAAQDPAATRPARTPACRSGGHSRLPLEGRSVDPGCRRSRAGATPARRRAAAASDALPAAGVVEGMEASPGGGSSCSASRASASACTSPTVCGRCLTRVRLVDQI
ncbi:unnamed protein product, partial [Urochloa humidicola]